MKVQLTLLCVLWTGKTLVLAQGSRNRHENNYLRQTEDVELPAANLSATLTTTPLDWKEIRSTYVRYPASASNLLTAQMQVITAPIGLEITSTMTRPDQQLQVWSLFKGIVHRFRKQNQIIHANPHYFISTGEEVSCRVTIQDPDINRATEIEMIPVPGHCAQHCTNHGRYCIIPPEDSESTGVELIEEILRRICFDQTYHASDLRFWEYMEAWSQLECRVGDSECSTQALGFVRQTSQHAIDNCMHLAGGTLEDRHNIHLQREIDHRKRESSRYAYAENDLPFIHFGGQQYSGEDWTVEDIFDFVCTVYHEHSGVRPVACDWCGHCSDVRKCLWTLKCDAKPFDATELTPVVAVTEVATTPPVVNESGPSLQNASIPVPPAEDPTAVLIGPFHDEVEDTNPTPSPTTFDEKAEREKQQEEMDELYIRWIIALCVLLGITFAIVCIREARRRRKRYLVDRYKSETEARWMARDMESRPNQYSTSWPTGLVPNFNESRRVSRKDRGKRSVRDQRINQDHSQMGQKSRLFAGFGRQQTHDGTSSMFSNQRNLIARRSSLENTPNRLMPGLARHLSLDQSGALRPSYISGRPRRSSMDDSSSRASDVLAGRADDRYTPAHAAALMEAAATSTAVPDQPMTRRRIRPVRTLEEILSEDDEEDEDDSIIGPNSERSGDRMHYSTNWLTGVNNPGEIDESGSAHDVPWRNSMPVVGDADPQNQLDGLEDVTTL